MCESRGELDGMGNKIYGQHEAKSPHAKPAERFRRVDVATQSAFEEGTDTGQDHEQQVGKKKLGFIVGGVGAERYPFPHCAKRIVIHGKTERVPPKKGA